MYYCFTDNEFNQKENVSLLILLSKTLQRISHCNSNNAHMINGESAINIYLYNIYTIYSFNSLCKYNYCAIYMQFIIN